MNRKIVTLLMIFYLIFHIGRLQASPVSVQRIDREKKLDRSIADSLKWSVNFLDKILYSSGGWYLTNHSLRKPIQGVLNYAQNDPLDTVIIDAHRILNDSNLVYLVDRRPQDISDKKIVPGFITQDEMEKRVAAIRKGVIDSLNLTTIVVPELVMSSELSKVPLVPQGYPEVMLTQRIKDLPPAFLKNFNKLLFEKQNGLNLTGAGMDSIRFQLFLNYRQIYNDSISAAVRERANYIFRTSYISEQTDRRVKEYKKNVDLQNLNALISFNDQMVRRVNDSLRIAVKYLTTHAEYDSTLVRISDNKNRETAFWTANREIKPVRLYLKNAQNDSVGVVMVNNGKGNIKLVIDDGVILTRFTQSQNKSITFATKAPEKNLHKIELTKIVLPPWKFVGTNNLGFTQTALSNWSKGGESSLSLLAVGRYQANYSKEKVKWENNMELRFGVAQSTTRGFEKNDDKIELQSRFGYSAFKKWYYSAESNFRTQFARGYAYPNKTNPISAFMAPGYWTLSLGMDYKPSSNFSLFLSPLTSKTTFVRDTTLINPKNFGLEPGKKRLWEPGMIAKANWHKQLAENIAYDTKGEFFNNYKYTFQKYAFQWEQLLTMQINRFINSQVMTNLVYDYNTKFPVRDSNGKVVGTTTKWQFKELFTIGFTYKF